MYNIDNNINCYFYINRYKDIIIFFVMNEIVKYVIQINRFRFNLLFLINDKKND